MDNIFVNIAVILALMVLNGLLSMSEIAVISSSKVRLEAAVNEGSAAAQTALNLANEPGRFLSTVQIGITLVSIITGVFSGATIAERLAVPIQSIPQLAPYAGSISFGIVVAFTTYLSLVIGELAPKQIGLNNPERVSLLVARPLAFLARLNSPLVKVLSISTTAVLTVLGIGSPEEKNVTEEEVRLLISQGTRSGVFEPIEEQMVRQVFRLSDRRVTSLITPRNEITWLDLGDTVEENLEKIIESDHSHLPVARDSLDNIEGYVRAVDLLAQCAGGEPMNIEKVIIPALFVPETMPAFHVLERFKETGSQIAFAIDEYGGLQGLITHQNMLEAIVGDINEPDEEPDPDVVQRADGTWLVDGMISIDEFKDLFKIKALPGEEQDYFQTLGGFVMTTLGRIPIVGDKVEIDTIKMEVIDLDGHRVDKVLITQQDEDSTGEENGQAKT